MVITTFHDTDEETGEIIQKFKAVIIRKEEEKQKAFDLFGECLRELHRQVSDVGKQKTVLLYNL